jgi:fermentation-respiration switch protein FrsA (DUF1100 family)
MDIKKTQVRFPSAGLSLAGDLYAPADAADSPRIGIVVGHPGTGVKEQAAGLYARRLAAEGFVALAYDAAYQGESEGEPRGLEEPAQRIEDLKSAITYMSTLDAVDADRLALCGICASGGYALAATAGDHRIKAVATVAGVDVARQFKLGADGTQDPAVYQQLLDGAAAARAGTADPTFELFPHTAEQAAAAGGEHGVEGYDYYCTARAEHPRSTKHMPWESVDRMAAFDAFAGVHLIAPRPLLQVIGREAVTAWMAVDVHQRARGDKRLHWVQGASHVDLYDKDPYVAEAVEKLAAFYTDKL